MLHFSNEDIIHGIMNNDSITINYLYEKVFKQVECMIVKNNGSYYDSQDIFHEALMILYHRIVNSKLTLNCSVTTYLYSVCKNLWLNELRKRKILTIKPADEFENFSSSNFTDDKLEKTKLKIYYKHFMELSKDCKRILHLYFNRHSVEYITKILGYSNKHHTVNQKYRCQQYLIKKIHNNPEFIKLKYEV
jgi:RNA polymerase sigma factor (sigma-70 family)